jgi:hypothetical protein
MENKEELKTNFSFCNYLVIKSKGVWRCGSRDEAERSEAPREAAEPRSRSEIGVNVFRPKVYRLGSASAAKTEPRWWRCGEC